MHYARILVPTDFGVSSTAAVDEAVDLARALRATVTLLHVCDVSPYVVSGHGQSTTELAHALDREAAETLEDERARIAAAVPTQCVIRSGDPVAVILEVARSTHADLVVMGTHGRRGVGRLVLGSVAERILRLSPVPVVTVRSREHASKPRLRTESEAGAPFVS